MLQKGKDCFRDAATVPESAKWEEAVGRTRPLYRRGSDIRTPFGRDYTRILHSMAYRRLKHKTQVYLSPENDHVSTRIDHVHYVVSVSRIIADYLGLNGELTEAIAIGHDLGHTPFGHDGERVFDAVAREAGLAGPAEDQVFWHGKNGLRCVDDLELLVGPDGKRRNLDLTYAVRDGIIAHSGNVTAGALRPRDEAVDLAQFKRPGHFAPFTWEACVVKMADNISYLGRDIDDAAVLGLMDPESMAQLAAIVRDYSKALGREAEGINNANVIHLMVTDLCENSTPEAGIRFSKEGNAAMTAVEAINRRTIYHHPRLAAYKDYGSLIIRRLYHVLTVLCEDLEGRRDSFSAQYPRLTEGFLTWLAKYWDGPRAADLENVVVYRTRTDPLAYRQAALDYLAGMTDRYIEALYREQVTF
jgi:dGTPase